MCKDIHIITNAGSGTDREDTHTHSLSPSLTHMHIHTHNHMQEVVQIEEYTHTSEVAFHAAEEVAHRHQAEMNTSQAQTASLQVIPNFIYVHMHVCMRENI